MSLSTVTAAFRMVLLHTNSLEGKVWTHQMEAHFPAFTKLSAILFPFKTVGSRHLWHSKAAAGQLAFTNFDLLEMTRKHISLPCSSVSKAEQATVSFQVKVSLARAAAFTNKFIEQLVGEEI